jgi:hypothetical protein
MKRFNLSEAASAILEGAKENLDASVASKRGQSDKGGKLDTSVAYGQKDVGSIGDAPEVMDETLPDYLKGTPSATPPGATPPVGKQGDGVGASKPQGQPQELK